MNEGAFPSRIASHTPDPASRTTKKKRSEKILKTAVERPLRAWSSPCLHKGGGGEGVAGYSFAPLCHVVRPCSSFALPLCSLLVPFSIYCLPLCGILLPFQRWSSANVLPSSSLALSVGGAVQSDQTISVWAR